MFRRKDTELAPREAPRSFFEEFDRIFEDFRAGMEDVFRKPIPSLASPWDGGVRVAPVDLKDAGKELVLTAELAGVRKEDLNIDVSEDGVAIRADVRREKEENGKDYYHQVRACSGWYRQIPFPEAVLRDGAEAELRDGVLTLRVPKKEPSQEPKARKVPVT